MNQSLTAMLKKLKKSGFSYSRFYMCWTPQTIYEFEKVASHFCIQLAPGIKLSSYAGHNG